MPMARTCSIASVLGKWLSIDIRVRPASIGSIVTRPSLRGKSSFGVPSSLREPVDEDESTRRIGLDDVPEAARLVAGRPGHVVLDVAAGRQVVGGEGGGVGRRTPPALELARIGPQLPDALRRRVELGGQGHGQGVGVLADGGDSHASVSLLLVMRSVMRSMRPRHSASYWSSRPRARRSPSMLVRTTLRRPRALLGDQAGPLEHGDVLLDRREAHRVVPGQLGDALAAAERAQDDVAPGGVGQGGEDVVGVEGGLH